VVVLDAVIALALDDRGGREPSRHTRDQVAVAVWQGVPAEVRSFLACVRRHESSTAGGYTAHNPYSSAAGAYQMLTGLWQGVAKWVPLAKPWAHSTADKAPAWAQDAVAIHIVLNGGRRAWNGTHCQGVS
jgi:hypothetical protein